MKKSSSGTQQGTVLLLTLIILSVLAVVVIHGMRTMQVATAGATMFRNGIQAERLAISGIRLAQAMLYQDLLADKEEEQIVDTLLEDWAVFPRTRDFVIPEILSGEIGLEIIDEQGKYPVNRLVEAGTGGEDVAKTLGGIVSTMLREAGIGEEESLEAARYVVWGLKDWMDRDTQTAIPVEFQDGQLVDVEELEDCRNAPLTDVNEIRLVLERLGISADLVDFLYEGNGAEIPGLKDLLSVAYTGGVNINTAHPLVLQAIARDVEKDVALPLAQAMDEYRRDAWNKDQLARSDWYRELAVEGSSFVTFSGAVTTSSWFTVRATGTVGAISKTGMATLQREENPDTAKSIPENVRVDRVKF
ncbi:type II secretion system minor pseudopilin [Desulfoplanes sp.]